MTLFQRGTFKLASGLESNFKIECDDLDAEDWQTLAWLLAKAVGPFGTAIGVPTGGAPLAYALQHYIDPEDPHCLIVDDVWTTGHSMLSFEGQHMRNLRSIPDLVPTLPPIKRAVVFGRGPVPNYVTCLFPIHRSAWDA